MTTSSSGPRRGLGRGLGSLIPTAPSPEAPAQPSSAPAAASPGAQASNRPDEVQAPAGAYFAELPIGEVVPNARQPRQVFDEEAMNELVHSIREVGLLQPVVVRRVADGSY